jgi:uncharacterized repeat protein (TIGR01451 family)
VIVPRRRPRCCLAFLVACLALPAASRAGGPDFGAVSWLPLGCDRTDMVSASSPAAASFAGDPANPPAFYGYDADYLYFRYRMDADPSSGGGFAQYSWTALMQVPSGSPFQYQYQLSLNGKSDTIEIWHNTTASDVSFTPLFHDDAEVQLLSVPYATETLARSVPANTSFHGQLDYFVDFAFPVPTLVANGVIASAADLAHALFFPATSTNPNNYNKSYLNCPFQPGTALQITKAVTPTVALPKQMTPVTYTIEVQNAGTRSANGVVVEDQSISTFLANVTVQVTTDDPDVVLPTPASLPVKAPTLGAGRHLTVRITGDATPSCVGGDFVNTASVQATNAFEKQASATTTPAPPRPARTGSARTSRSRTAWPARPPPTVPATTTPAPPTPAPLASARTRPPRAVSCSAALLPTAMTATPARPRPVAPVSAAPRPRRAARPARRRRTATIPIPARPTRAALRGAAS